MIRGDWPTCFPKNIFIAISSVADGTMLDRAVGIHHESIRTNRTKFVAELGLSYGDLVFQRIVYGDRQTYDIISQVDATDTTKHKSEVITDALMTNQSGVGLFLPVADCIATVIYDPDLQRIALLHLGRHSTLAGLMKKTLLSMRQSGSDPASLIIWFGPSVQKQSYRLDYFKPDNQSEWREFVTTKKDGIYIDMQGYNQAQALAGGVKPENIYSSGVDTVKSDDYFSHSSGDTKGRFGIVVMMKH